MLKQYTSSPDFRLVTRLRDALLAMLARGSMTGRVPCNLKNPEPQNPWLTEIIVKTPPLTALRQAQGGELIEPRIEHPEGIIHPKGTSPPPLRSISLYTFLYLQIHVTNATRKAPPQPRGGGSVCRDGGAFHGHLSQGGKKLLGSAFYHPLSLEARTERDSA